MAEDLLPPPKRGMTLEEVGHECFDDLASRLFFKQFRTDGKYFVMHDLMHDLATSLAGEFYFRSEELGNADEMSMRTHHLSYRRLSHSISKIFDAISRVKSLRTLLQIQTAFSVPLFSIGNILSEFKCLRVLSFACFWDLDVVSDSIGELIHLRYLNLSHTNIETLPESLSNLYNLQTLNLLKCHNLSMLPNGMQNLVNLRHLYIEGTNLKEMPRGMSKLKKLQVLDYFVVGKHEENGITELGELSNTDESLFISKLENVASSSEALKARIMDKTHIETLCLGWSTGGDVVTSISSQVERDIFDKLQPHKDLQVLMIKGYRGTIFPDWVGHSSYHNMTRISLTSCSNCCMLPSLGQLPSLKSLEISNCCMLLLIGEEFYKSNDDHSSLAIPFPSLEYLTFCEMPCWEVWHSFESNAFLQLKKLVISDCPMLKGDLPNHLPTMETLEVKRCPGLTGNLPNHLSALQTLEIDSCDMLVTPLPKAPTIQELSTHKSNKVELQEMSHSLQSISIGGCEVVKFMFQGITISHLTCLQSLTIKDCSCAISFPGDRVPVSVKTLEISHCRKLEFPRQHHELLESLSTRKSCDSLTSFPLDSFPKLKSLRLRCCENLESLSVSQPQDVVLHHLKITGCPNLISFSGEGLAAPNMDYFKIKKCNKLKSLPCHMNTLLPKLEDLLISHCSEIELFPDGGLPPNLIAIRIYNCEKLLSDLSSIGVHESLTLLDISGPCESFKSFPKEGLLRHLPSLTYLNMYKFSSLETLDCKELLHLTSLQRLSIIKCPKLENMIGERLPASLIELIIYDSPLLEERCKMKHPQIWPKISHIIGIRVTGGWIS